jgi:hypothetical protein
MFLDKGGYAALKANRAAYPPSEEEVRGTKAGGRGGQGRAWRAGWWCWADATGAWSRLQTPMRVVSGE